MLLSIRILKGIITFPRVNILIPMYIVHTQFTYVIMSYKLTRLVNVAILWFKKTPELHHTLLTN